jgi:lipopolysaccharide/colanic/teichoic acid biosynthesis glycosyltransferase
MSAPDSDESVEGPAGFALAVKHGLDRVIATILLVALIPALVLLALAVRLSSPGPVLCRQRRVTRGGRGFELLKLRAMYATRGGEDCATRRFIDGGLAPGGIEERDRRTAVGRFLRRTSLDELPQLINVVRGEMSLVGPRPERSELVELFAHEIRGLPRSSPGQGRNDWFGPSPRLARADLAPRARELRPQLTSPTGRCGSTSKSWPGPSSR